MTTMFIKTRGIASWVKMLRAGNCIFPANNCKLFDTEDKYVVRFDFAPEFSKVTDFLAKILHFLHFFLYWYSNSLTGRGVVPFLRCH